jgi:hypothetical protein
VRAVEETFFISFDVWKRETSIDSHGNASAVLVTGAISLGSFPSLPTGC